MSELRKDLGDYQGFKIEAEDISEFIKAVKPLGDEIARIYKEMNIPLHWGEAFFFHIENGEWKRGLFSVWMPVNSQKDTGVQSSVSGSNKNIDKSSPS